MITRTFFKFVVYAGSPILLLVFLYSFKTPLNAATLSFSPAGGSYAIGQTIGISVYVNSQGQAMNAVSGVISFPTSVLQAVSVSKAGSILTLWPEEPSFSNGNGTVNFEGVALSPGYSGASGKIITVNFKIKSTGSAELIFSSASVLANDGQGTNILTGVGKADFTLKSASVYTAPVKTTTKTFADITPPTNLTVTEIQRADPTDPVIHLSLKAQDSQSGIDHYEIHTDNNAEGQIEKSGEYISLPLSHGRHVFFVKVFDKVGNNAEASLQVEIAPLTPPAITYFQPTIVNGNPLVIKGTSKYPYAEITLKFKPPEGEAKEYPASTDASGNFTFVYPEDLKNGIYEIKAAVTDGRGASSLDTSPITITVEPGAMTRVASKATNVLTVAIPLIALVILLIMMLYYAWHSYKSLRKKVSKEASEAETVATSAFTRLEKTVMDEIAFLENIEKDRGLTEGERYFLAKLKSDLEEAQKGVQKEIKDIENL